MTPAPQPADTQRRATQRRANRALLVRLSVVVVMMFGFGYLLVPFYDTICRVIGLNNIARADTPVNSQVDTSRAVRIELVSNVHNMGWRFHPIQPTMTVHPGELSHAEFEVVNVAGHAVTGQAIPSYGPRQAAQYFRKLECFCFSQQTLAAGEARRMPVVFVIDPAMPRDVTTITLSYTFFEVEGNRKG